MEYIEGGQDRIGMNEAIDVAKFGILIAREGASWVEQQVWYGWKGGSVCGPDRPWCMVYWCRSLCSF